MPNRALAFGRSCAAGKGGASGALATFSTIFSVVSTAVGITYRSWVTGRERDRGGGERKRETCKGIHERKREVL